MPLQKMLCQILVISLLVITINGCVQQHSQYLKTDLQKEKENFYVQNYDLSFQQIKEAAEASDPEAEYTLGYMYYYGKGTTQDIYQGKKWIDRAADHGQLQAIRAQRILARQPQFRNLETHVNDNASDDDEGDNTDHPDNRSVNHSDSDSSTHAENSTIKSVPVGQSVQATQGISAAQTQPIVINLLNEQRSEKPQKLAKTEKSQSSQKLQKSLQLETDDYVQAEKNILSIGDDKQTIQLRASYDLKDAQRLIRRYQLSSQASYYRTLHNGKKWYVVIYGIYDSRQQALAALESLPSSLSKESAKPWVKSYARVHKEILHPK